MGICQLRRGLEGEWSVLQLQREFVAWGQVLEVGKLLFGFLDLMMQRERLPFVLLRTSSQYSKINRVILFEIPFLSWFCDPVDYALVRSKRIVQETRVSQKGRKLVSRLYSTI